MSKMISAAFAFRKSPTLSFRLSALLGLRLSALRGLRLSALRGLRLSAILVVGLLTLPSHAGAEQPGLAGLFLSARHAQMSADPAAAAEFYDQALKIDPDNRGMTFNAYFQKAQAGDIEGALPYAAAAYADRPSLSVAPLLIAIDHYSKGRFEEARDIIEGISDRSNVGLALPLLRTWALAPLKTPAEALASLAPYEGRAEWRVLAATMSALVNEYYGQTDAALVYYRALASQIESHPLSVLRLITGAFHRLGHSDEAVAAIAQFRETRGESALWSGYLAQYEDPDKAPPAVTAQVGMAEALYAITRIRMASARRASGLQLGLVYAHMALYLNPDLDSLRREVADAMSIRGQYDAANMMLNAIEPNDPGYLIAQLRLAENFERQSKTEEAIALLEELARLRPTLPEPLISLGDILRNRQRFDEAVATYDRAFSRYPNGEPTSWALYYTRGMALERAQNWKRAEADFKRALELSPEQAQVLNYLGYSWLDQGKNVAEARRMIETAVSLRPEDGFIIDSLGWAMYLMGEYEDAVVQLERAVTINTSDPTINEHLGDAYWQVGRENEARFQWRRALSLEPDSEQAEQLRDKLQRGIARN